jgi:uncharacterized membrane protein YgcG
MKVLLKITAPAVLCGAALAMLAGCSTWYNGVARRTERRVPTDPLGTQSDQIWRQQAAGAAASQFVVYQHEFEKDGLRLNMDGEDHVKAIAARLRCGASMPVIVERSMTSKRLDTKYQYPIHPNPELDMRRRQVVVASLMTLGVPNADQCVVVAPALTPGFTATEAARAYSRGLSRSTSSSGSGRGIAGSGTASSIGDVGSSGASGL